MRFSITAITISCLAVVSAAGEYNSYTLAFKPDGPCVNKCTVDTGKKMFPNYSEDPNSPYFMESLGYTYDKGSPKTTSYMAQAGMCMMACPKEELDLNIQQYPAKLAWYLTAKEISANTASTPTSGASLSTGAASGVVMTVAAVVAAVALL